MTTVPSSRVLLLMPPLTHVLCHPDIGIPLLTAYLRARGHGVTQMDLNTALLYRRLYQAGDLGALASELPPPAQRLLLGALPFQRARIQQMTAALDRMGLPRAAL